MSGPVVRSQELRSLLRDRVQLLLLASFAVICVYAILQGAQYRADLASSAQGFLADELADNEEWRDRMVAIEAGETAAADDRWAGLAMGVARPAVARPGLLADLSHGVSDVQPYAARVSLWRSIERLFGNYQFQNPNEVRAGQVDLSFVVLLVMPLVMIATCFGVLSDDSDSGRLALVLSQPLSTRDLVGARLSVRLGIVLCIVLGALVLALFWGAIGWPDSERLKAFLVWLAVAVLYFGAWACVIFWVVSLNRSGEASALLLVGIWTMNCLVGPAIVSSAVQAVYPAPSQMAFLSTAREASSAAYRSKSDVMAGMLLDHPDLTVENYSIPEYIRTSFLVTQAVDRRVQPILQDFDQVQAQRRRFLDYTQYLTPAAVAMRAMNLASGTDLDRQIRFEREVRDYKMAITEYVEANVLAGQRLSVAEIDAIPEFEFEELKVASLLKRVAFPALFLLLLSVVFRHMAVRNLRELQTRLLEAR